MEEDILNYLSTPHVSCDTLYLKYQTDSFLILTNIIGFTYSPPINGYKIVSNSHLYVAVLLLASSYRLLIHSFIPPPLAKNAPPGILYTRHLTKGFQNSSPENSIPPLHSSLNVHVLPYLVSKLIEIPGIRLNSLKQLNVLREWPTLYGGWTEYVVLWTIFMG